VVSAQLLETTCKQISYNYIMGLIMHFCYGTKKIEKNMTECSSVHI